LPPPPVASSNRPAAAAPPAPPSPPSRGRRGWTPAGWRPAAAFLRAYQLGGGYTPGPLLSVVALAGLAGSLLTLRRGLSRDRRRLALGCLLYFATAAAVLPVSDAFEFSWRCQLPALVTLPPADALGLACLARSARRRAPGGRAPGGRPRHSRAAGRELQHAHVRLVQAPLHPAQVRVGQPRQFASWRRDRLARLRWVGENSPGFQPRVPRIWHLAPGKCKAVRLTCTCAAALESPAGRACGGLLGVALLGRRAFPGAQQRPACLEHVLSELPLGGEQLPGEVVGAGHELLGLGQLVAGGQAGRRDGRRD